VTKGSYRLLQDIVACHPEVVPVRRMRTGMSNTWRPRLNNLREPDIWTAMPNSGQFPSSAWSVRICADSGRHVCQVLRKVQYRFLRLGGVVPSPHAAHLAALGALW